MSYGHITIPAVALPMLPTPRRTLKEGHMNKMPKLQTALLAGFIAMLFTAPVLATDDDMPAPMKQGDIAYITGGVGLEEKEAMEKVAKDYNLHISIAAKSGHYTLADSVIIKGKEGETVLNIKGADPLLYVKLPAGDYKLEVTSEKKTQTGKVTITEGKPTVLHFAW